MSYKNPEKAVIGAVQKAILKLLSEHQNLKFSILTISEKLRKKERQAVLSACSGLEDIGLVIITGKEEESKNPSPKLYGTRVFAQISPFGYRFYRHFHKDNPIVKERFCRFCHQKFILNIDRQKRRMTNYSEVQKHFKEFHKMNKQVIARNFLTVDDRRFIVNQPDESESQHTQVKRLFSTTWQ